VVAWWKFFAEGQTVPWSKPQPSPRIPHRGSVSTPIPPQWITLDQLLTETGIDKDRLNHLRQRFRYVIPRPLVVPLPTGRGTIAWYPPETGSIIIGLQALRRETPGIGADDALWQLWLKDHAVDMRGWAVERLDATAAWMRKSYPYPPSADALNAVAARWARAYSSQQNAARIRDLADWWLSLSVGQSDDAAADLHSPDPSILEALDEVQAPDVPILETLFEIVGLSINESRAAEIGAMIDPSDMEILSTARLAKFVADASLKEMNQARCDFRMIASLFSKAQALDWVVAASIFWSAIEWATGVKTEPSSQQARRTRPERPPKPIREIIAGWRDYNVRVRWLASLIAIRRYPDRMRGLGAVLDQGLAFLDSALTSLPQRPHDEGTTR
jgi:hypothetical protein